MCLFDFQQGMSPKDCLANNATDCRHLQVAFFECKRSLVRDTVCMSCTYTTYYVYLQKINDDFGMLINIFSHSWTTEFASGGGKDIEHLKITYLYCQRLL